MYASSNPVTFVDPLGLKVLRCCRDLEVNRVVDFAARTLRFKHCFIKTDTVEAGMGPADNGPLPACPLGVSTAVVDHRGQGRLPGTECVEVPNVDEECVNKQLKTGRRTGSWGPSNNCDTFADGVLGRCRNRCEMITRPPVPPGDDGRRYF